MEKFFFSTIIELNEGEETSVIQILRLGDFHHSRYGQFSVTEETMDSMIANFPGPDRLPLDYNHGSMDPNPERSRAAGWIVRVFKDEDPENGTRLMAEVKFTEMARQLVANGEFRYISPEFTFNRVNQESGAQQGPTLLAAALTNRPFLPAMAPVTLNDEGWIEDQMSPEEKAEIALNEKIETTLRDMSNNPESNFNLTEESLTEKVNNVTRAFYSQYRDNETTIYWVKDVRDDNAIIERQMRNAGSKLFRVNFDDSGNAIEFDAPEQWQEVRRTYEAVQATQPEESNLPLSEEGSPMDKELLKILGLSEDADEAAIATAVTALVDKAGKIDELETSLADSQTSVKDLQAEVAKLSEQGEDSEESEEEVQKLTDENAKMSKTLTDVQEENTRLSDQVKTLMDDKRQREADVRVTKALRDRKLTPAEVDGEDSPMRKLALSDPDTFDEIVKAKPAYDAAMLSLNSEDGEQPEVEKDQDAVDTYWETWNKLSDEHPNKESHQIHELMETDHSDIVKAAGL